MKIYRRILVSLFIILVMNISVLAQVKVISVEATPFFPKVEKGNALKQLAHMYVESAKEMSVKVRIRVDGHASYTQDFHLKKGMDTLGISVLDINNPTKIKFELLNTNQIALAEKEMTWQPQKKWKVYYAAVSHQDLGWLTYYQNLRRGNREGGIDVALEFCAITDDWEEENSKFRWNVESSEPILRWMSKQTPEKIKEFERRIQEGRISISAIHNTISSQMAGYEVLARSFYTPNRYVIDKLNIEPAKLAIINDVTGITRSWPLYSKEAQIPYLMHGSNYPNNLNDMYDLPVFFWKSPDGDEENRTLCRTDSYYSPNKVYSWDLEGVKYLIDRHVNLNWEYDCILAYDSHDFAVPTLDNAKNIRVWNSTYEYPKIRCSLIESFFEDIAGQIDPEKVHETTKDAPDSWDDQDATDADLLGKARRVNFEIPTTEKFATIAMALSGGYPEKDIFNAYNRTVMYHEHTNGAFKGSNHQYYETERVMHQTLIDEAIAFNQNALEVSLNKIGTQIKTKSNAMVVYNPLNWERDELVYFDASQVPYGNFEIIDPESNKRVDVQKLTNGKLVFFAEDIPAMGYKTYRIKKTSKESLNRSKLSVDNLFENDFYQLKIDKEKNKIVELVDKGLNKNIIDKSSPYALGEYIHYDYRTDTWKPTEFTAIECFKGELLDEIHISQKAYLTSNIKLVVYLHHKTKKIDFALEVDKLSNGEELVATWVRYLQEASFCAIPVNVPNYQHHHELAGAVTQPGNKDLQFEASESAYYAIQHFADASNKEFGVTLSTIESALVEYGFPRPSIWNASGARPKEEIEKPKNSNMFLYLMNNFFHTNVQVDQPGITNFTFSINSHSGDWKKGKAYKFAWESSHPLISQFIEKNKRGILDTEKSFLEVDKDNVICSALKKAESNGEGYVLRFFELEGKTSQVKMKLNFSQKIDKAYALSLIENNLEELKINTNNEVEFEIKGHGIKTIRVVSQPAEIASVQGLSAKALSNAEIELSWSPNALNNSSHYNVYRSVFEDCPANALNFIGTSETASYLDKTELQYGGWGHKRLDENTQYYYRVVPVDRFNNIGKASEIIPCKTLPTSQRDGVPNKVLGVYTVHVSPLAPENYINVWFYTNFEKDVDKYEIHRGETADFVPNAQNLIHTLVPSADSMLFSSTYYSNLELNRQMYADKTAKFNKAYYYKVCAVDNNGNKGEYSNPAFAFMEVSPITISTKEEVYTKFELFQPKAMVTIECSLNDCELYYSFEDPMVQKGAVKYEGAFEINKSTYINVAAYKKGQMEPVYTHRRLCFVSNVLSQSDYSPYYNALKALEVSSIWEKWVSKQYGGGTKDNPADVWWGMNLLPGTTFTGVKIVGEDYGMTPIQNKFRMFIRNNGVLTEIKNFNLVPDKGVRNSYVLEFKEEVSADGVMVYFDKDELPKSTLPEQDGFVKINELTLITQNK